MKRGAVVAVAVVGSALVGFWAGVLTHGTMITPDWVEAIGTWFGAIATTAAVVLALSISRNDKRERIDASTRRARAIVAQFSAEVYEAAHAAAQLKLSLELMDGMGQGFNRAAVMEAVESLRFPKLESQAHSFAELPGPLSRALLRFPAAVAYSRQQLELGCLHHDLPSSESMIRWAARSLASDIIPTAEELWRLEHGTRPPAYERYARERLDLDYPFPTTANTTGKPPRYE